MSGNVSFRPPGVYFRPYGSDAWQYLGESGGIDFTIEDEPSALAAGPCSVTLPCTLRVSQRTRAAMKLAPPYRFKRAGRSRRKRARR